MAPAYGKPYASFGVLDWERVNKKGKLNRSVTSQCTTNLGPPLTHILTRGTEESADSSSVNPVTNPKPIYGQYLSRDSILKPWEGKGGEKTKTWAWQESVAVCVPEGSSYRIAYHSVSSLSAHNVRAAREFLCNKRDSVMVTSCTSSWEAFGSNLGLDSHCPIRGEPG
jgi:hypothetical protein